MFRETYRHTQRIGSHWNLTNDLENFHPRESDHSSMTRPSAILIRWRCGCCCKSSATLPTKPRRLGATNSIHAAVKPTHGVFYWWLRWVASFTSRFLEKRQIWGQKKGKGESIFLLWNWLKNQFKQEVGRWFWGIQVILVSPWHHWWYHRHHAGLLRYDGDELVPSKSLEKELHEIQAKCAGKGTLSPRIMEVMNRSSWRYTHFPFNYACGRKSI